MTTTTGAAGEAKLADQFRRDQQMVATTLTRDFLHLLRSLFNVQDPAQSWPAVKMAAGAMVNDRRRKSADLVGPYYRRVRRAAGLASDVRVSLPAPLNPERLDATLDITGIGMYERALRAGADAPAALDRSAVTLSGAASRLALEGGRTALEDTVLHDSDAVGWARVGGATPCAWCAMLISRGAVYKSGATAGDVMHGGQKYHDHDGCQAVPIFDEDHPHIERADALYEQWVRETQGYSGQDAVNAWRRYWDNRTEADVHEVERG